MATLYFILLGYDKGPHPEKHSGAFYAEKPRKSEVRELLDEATLALLESDEETGSSESDEELASTSNSQRRKRNRSPQEPTKDDCPYIIDTPVGECIVACF